MREHGRGARRLSPQKRSALRRALAKRESDRLNKRKAASMRQIAERYGCSRRTAIRERNWMLVDGSMEKALEKAGR